MLDVNDWGEKGLRFIHGVLKTIEEGWDSAINDLQIKIMFQLIGF